MIRLIGADGALEAMSCGEPMAGQILFVHRRGDTTRPIDMHARNPSIFTA